MTAAPTMPIVVMVMMVTVMANTEMTPVVASMAPVVTPVVASMC